MKYEFMVIIKPFLPEDVRIKLQESIKKTITSKKGEIRDEDVWGKRHLAYDIGGHEEGYYIVYDITLDNPKVNEVEKELQMIGDVLRFLIIKKE